MSQFDPNLDSTAPDTAIMVEGVDYDRRDAKSGLIAIVSIAILGVLVVMIVGVYWLYIEAYQRVDQEVYAGAPSQELQAIHEREEENLHRYSYIDKEKGVIRIPIDQAMQIVANEFGEGKVSYNTTSYPAKPEPPGGAAGGANPPAVQPGAAPAAQPAAPPAAPEAAHKAGH